MNVGCAQELRQLKDLLGESQADPSSICSCVRAILEYLVIPEHNVAENCDAVARYLVADVLYSGKARMDLKALPDPLALIIEDMAHFLDDAHSAPEVAAEFDSLPEQLLGRLNAWSAEQR